MATFAVSWLLSQRNRRVVGDCERKPPCVPEPSSRRSSSVLFSYAPPSLSVWAAACAVTLAVALERPRWEKPFPPYPPDQAPVVSVKRGSLAPRAVWGAKSSRDVVRESATE